MAKAKLEFPPFPRLTWDGDFWRGPFPVPSFAKDKKPELIVQTLDSAAGPLPRGTAPPLPDEAQTAAFQRLASQEMPLRETLLPALREKLSELAEADWGGVQKFLELVTVFVSRPSLDGESYVGLVLEPRDWEAGYEHGIGIVVHKERIVLFGFADQACDDQPALKDIRRAKRSGGTKKSS